jgi:hypothetical protein
MYIPPNIDVLELWVNKKRREGVPSSDIATELRKRLKMDWGQAIGTGPMSQLVEERREQANELIAQLEREEAPVAA